MPTVDALGRLIPNSGDTADVPAALAAYSTSAPPGALTVGSRAEANSVLAAWQAQGGEGHLEVWRTDENHAERWTGSRWDYVYGRRHGADVTFRREGINEGGLGLLHAQTFHNASPGWTINGAAWLVIPETGLYIAGIDYNIEGGGAASLGRVFFQLTLRGGGADGTGVGFRVAATNENNWGGSIPWHFTKGQELQIRGRAEGGGTRTHAARMVIAMLGDPNW